MPSFAQPFWLAAGLLACCVASLFLIFSTLRRRKMLERFASPHLLPILTANVSLTRRRLKDACFLAGLACLFLALARPQWGHHVIELRSRGIDILIGFDVSKSMLAPDLKPSRLQRAKLAVRDFTAKLDGDRIGLLPFAGASFLLCPLTADYEAFNAALDALDVTAIPKGGTDVGRAIREAAKILANESNHKILLLLTDGEDLGQQALAAAELVKQEQLLIYTIGVGTPQGELIPLLGSGPGNFVKDGNGAFVTSKLDETMLTAIAEKTGGSYVPLGNMGQGLDTVRERKLAMIPKEERGQRTKKVPIERFQWPLGAAVLLFSLEFLLIGRRNPLRLPFITTAGRRWQKKRQAAAALLLVFCAAPVQADEGSALFQAGNYQEAAKLYQRKLAEDSSNPAVHFNLGAALHKQGSYERAAEEFSKALQTDDVALQEKSYYNRGASQYAAGRALESANLNQAVRQLQQAKQSFAAALRLMPENKPAARSLQMVENKLAELEKRQQEQQARDKKESEASKQQQQNQQQGGKDSAEKQRADSEKQQEQGKSQQRSGMDAEKKKEPPQDGQAAAAPSDKEGKKDATADSQAVPTDRKPSQGQEKEEAKMIGKMTEEEAKSLLDSLKSEQGELNFMPQEAADNEAVGRDW